MIGKVKNIIEKLNQNVLDDDFITISYEIIEQLEEIPESIEAIEPIIKLIEMNPDADFGTPGPLVHFLEKFGENAYYYKLIESIKRQPTSHTLFMFNRIVNSLKGKKRIEYLQIFDFVINAIDFDEGIKKIAAEFKEYHQS